MTRAIGMLVLDDVEAPDFAGPNAVLTCASRVAGMLTIALHCSASPY